MSYFTIPLRASAALLALALAAAGCGGADGAPAAEAAPARAVAAVDDRGDTVRLAAPAARIVSLVPSATETLLALGARGRLVGRTDYDTDPSIQALPSVGGALDPGVEALLALRPDLVVGWSPPGGSALAERLRELGIPFYALTTTDTADVFRTIAGLGALTGGDAAADSLLASVRAELEAVRASVAGRERPSAFYVVSADPPMTAGPWTFTAQLLELAGGRNAFPDVRGQPQVVSLEEVVRRSPDVVLVADGSGVAADRLAELPGWREVEAVRAGRVRVLPESVGRPGPHLGEIARAMRDALHPDAAPR